MSNSDLLHAFLNGEDVEKDNQSGENKEFKITKIKHQKSYKADWMTEPAKEVLLFKLESKEEEPVIVFQSLLNRKGEPSKNLFYGMTYENERFFAPSTFLDLREAVKSKLGEEKYKKEKEKHGGINKNFFLNKKVDMIDTPIGYQLPLQAKAGLWKWIVKEEKKENPDFDFTDIPEFREYFNIKREEITPEEVEKKVDEIKSEDLPF